MNTERSTKDFNLCHLIGIKMTDAVKDCLILIILKSKSTQIKSVRRRCCPLLSNDLHNSAVATALSQEGALGVTGRNKMSVKA